jgi:HlyD family secretion protein
MKKSLLLSILGVTVAASAAMVTKERSRGPAARPEGQPRQETIFAMGRTEGVTKESELRLELSARVAEVLVREGQTVEPGQVLVRLEDQQYRQEVALAEADLALAQATLERLTNGAHQEQRAEAAALYQAKLAGLERGQRDWQRIRTLLKSRVVPEQEADSQRTLVTSLTKEVEAAKARLDLLNAPARADEVRVDQAHIQAAQARLELAKVQLARTELRSPRRGQVLKADVQPGEMAGPASPEPAVILADTSRFQVRAFVEELDAPRVQTGMQATITAEGMPGVQIRGHVSRLSPCMTRKELTSDRPGERLDTKVREVWIELDGSAALFVGLRVDVVIETHERQPDQKKP